MFFNFYYYFDIKAIVPDGICITTVAMKNHINENKDLLNSLNDTIKIAKESNFKQISDNCKRLKKKKTSILL